MNYIVIHNDNNIPSGCLLIIQLRFELPRSDPQYPTFVVIRTQFRFVMSVIKRKFDTDVFSDKFLYLLMPIQKSNMGMLFTICAIKI